MNRSYNSKLIYSILTLFSDVITVQVSGNNQTNACLNSISYVKYTTNNEDLMTRSPRTLYSEQGTAGQIRREDLNVILKLSEHYVASRNLDYITVYWDLEDDDILLRWYKNYDQSVPVNIKLCAPTGGDPAEHAFGLKDAAVVGTGMHVMLCNGRLQEKYLTQALVRRGYGHDDDFLVSRLAGHWLLVDLDDNDVLSQDYFIPLDSMVIRPERADRGFTLNAIWSTAKGLPQKSHLIGWFETKPLGKQHGNNGRTFEQPFGQNEPSDICNERNNVELEREGLPFDKKVEYRDVSYALTFSRERKYDYRMDMSGIHFVVTSINNTQAHYSSYDSSLDRFVMSGVFGEIFEIAKTKMNFTYSVVSPADDEFGVLLDNGSWTGLVRDLVSRRADIAVAFLTKTMSRWEAISFSATILNFRYRIFAQIPSSSTLRWQAYTRPYSATMWHVVFVSFFVLSGVFALASHLCSYNLKNIIKNRDDSICTKDSPKNPKNFDRSRINQHFSDANRQHLTRPRVLSHSSRNSNFRHKLLAKVDQTFTQNGKTDTISELKFSTSNEKNIKEIRNLIEWRNVAWLVVWSAFVQQGFPDSPRQMPLRAIFLLIYTVGLLLLTAYSATLISFLTVTDNSLPFDSFSTLAALKDYRLGIQIGSVTEELLLSPSYVKLYEQLVEPHKDTQSRNFTALKLSALRDPYFAVLATYEVQRSSYDGGCLLANSKLDLMFNDGAFAFRKGSHFVPLFSYFINQVKESGILEKIILKYYPSYTCPDTFDMSVGYKQVFTAFLCLVMGMTLAAVMLGLEMLAWRRSSRLRPDV
ncbi:Ionotropic receptor 200 [Hyalella azteca]|uniref:Ionotropic receptor 200 n=1 Tax=Hyalella azteca TaxID=294128 RepID=A0A6A0HAK9_HYAAZ|nr:Ionotropic receptor 200 [Hyalella azteca]